MDMMKRYNDLKWREGMRVRLDYNNMMADFITGSDAITQEKLSSYHSRVSAAAESMDVKRKLGGMRWRDLPYNQREVVLDIVSTAKDISEQYDDFVLLGIGGSALGPMAVHQAINHLHYNDLPKAKRGGKPRFFVIDNIDPERLYALLDVIDVKKTLFNVITKSGSTSETMAQFLLVQDLLKRHMGKDYAKQIVAITDEQKGSLIKIAKEEGYKTFYVPDGVGGRFSQLCPVGLLPAAVCGIDIEEMLAGAAYMDELCSTHDLYSNPAYMGGLLQYIAMTSGKNITVMMPYADSLKLMSDWYAQLWAESLGKKLSLDGQAVYAGQTPVKALGVTDQHSQVQLYTEGPFDKVITFLTVDEYRNQLSIPIGFESIPDVSFLGGHSFGELIKAEQIATEYALLKAQRLNMTISFPEVNAFTVGQFLYLLEVQTAFAGELLNINAFDQPGVEEGKEATYALMGRPGFESKKEELDVRKPKKCEYII
jgi:glucose-6-phosphate isomerase